MAKMTLKFKVDDPYFGYQTRVSHDAYMVQFGDSSDELFPQTSRTLQGCHNEHDGGSNHQPNDCLLNRLFRRRYKKALKLHVTDLCAGKSPGTDEFPAQMASNAENVSIS